jgi:hypothetical protein
VRLQGYEALIVQKVGRILRLRPVGVVLVPKRARAERRSEEGDGRDPDGDLGQPKPGLSIGTQQHLISGLDS